MTAQGKGSFSGKPILDDRRGVGEAIAPLLVHDARTGGMQRRLEMSRLRHSDFQCQ